MSIPNDDFGIKQTGALLAKIGGIPAAMRILAGEAVVVSRERTVSAEGLADGGVNYAPTQVVDVQAFLADQRNFFREVYGRRQLPRVKLPQQRQGFSWGLIMASFMTPQWLYDCARERIGAAKYDQRSLDELLNWKEEARDAARDGAYALWCRNRVAADEEHKSKSADDITAATVSAMTLAEHENLFLWFHWKTGKLLNPSTATLCAGSRNWNDSVPIGMVLDGRFGVGWVHRNRAHSLARAREVVIG